MDLAKWMNETLKKQTLRESRRAARKKCAPTENQIAQQVVDYLRLHGWRVHRLEADLRGPRARVKREEAGTPDYIAVRNSSGPGSTCDVWYVEVKRPGGRLRRSQQIWIEDARRRGWNVAVASSIDDLLEAGMPGFDERLRED
jgi:hypothetical protein